MLEGEDVLRICIEHKITIQQYFFMYLISRRDFHLADNRSLGKQYLLKVRIFEPEEIRDLYERGFIDDFNTPGQYYPEMYVLRDKMMSVFADDEMAEELYNTYPTTIRLSDKGSRFIARAGADKDEMLQLYLKKINFSAKKHKFVMQQLLIYMELVERGEINGYKLIDFIKQELWDLIPSMVSDKQKGGDFGRDI